MHKIITPASTTPFNFTICACKLRGCLPFSFQWLPPFALFIFSHYLVMRSLKSYPRSYSVVPMRQKQLEPALPLSEASVVCVPAHS